MSARAETGSEAGNEAAPGLGSGPAVAAVLTPITQAPSSTWSPLRIKIFRYIWLAQLGSNVGTWMQTVGAQWFLVHQPHAIALVALVQTAASLPFMLIGLPAGVLADVFDRRRYLISVQSLLVVTAALMSLLTFAGRMTPELLLFLTFVLGGGMALSMPAWQAIVPSLVTRRDLPQASALSGMSQNLARAIGPAIAGLLVAQIGVGAVFAVNAVSFVGGIAVMALWKAPKREEGVLGRERLVSALRTGTRYVQHSPLVRRLLLRMILFIVPASALWALLPVVAARSLQLGSSGYGLLLGSLGVGAVAGVLSLRQLRQRWSINRLFALASAVYALALVVSALVPHLWAVLPTLVLAGAAWLTTMVSVSASMQLVLPEWVRARGLAVYQFVFMGGQALSALAWGLLAQSLGLSVALATAGALLFLSILTIKRWPLRDVSQLDPTPYKSDAPELALDPEPETGPVLVTIAYTVDPTNATAFISAMQPVGRSRRRTGASRWRLYRDGEDPTRFLETYVVPTWEEHLRQHHGRMTTTDRGFLERARRLCESEPEVAHLFPPRTPLSEGLELEVQQSASFPEPRS